LIIWLHDHHNCAVVVFSDTGQSTGRLFHTREQVTEHIGRLIDSLPKPDLGFRSEPLTIGASVFDTRWRVAREILTAEIEHYQRSSLLDALFSGFYSLSSRCGSSGDYCISEVGGAVKVQFPSQLKGDTFRRMYDENYGRWIADTMRDVRPDDSALTQTISAPIMWPGSQQPIVHQYTRLVVGFEAESRQHLLTATQVHSKTERRLTQMMR
jgi:hypothetical protein